MHVPRMDSESRVGAKRPARSITALKIKKFLSRIRVLIH